MDAAKGSLDGAGTANAPFGAVLVANRGEIACRIIRTLHRMGIRAVAVFHALDRAAPHVALADTAVELHAEVPTAAYLDAAQMVRAAHATGAAAIHPGYGFLSENAAFAAAVTAAGIAFIGPDAATISLMGDKIRARDFAVAHGVPVSPSVTDHGDLGVFLERARGIGVPLLIKAAAGGGGKGMRIVRHLDELAESARIASGEAARYFGDGRIYAERLIETPRHIEAQVLGDGRGGVLYLHERDCSIQRRYQKIIEEAPAPDLPTSVRERIRDAATRLAAAANYRNAGTVEFVLAPDGTCYFLEMNTRLQVEHPVTEAILGIDLVAEQIRIAAGLGASFTQDDVQPRGHAIECRICAEDPEQDFRPATGRIGLLRAPLGEGVRFDSGVREGQVISAAFDSMIAKLVVAAPTRAAAIERMRAALDQLAVLGVTTNSDYLGAVLRHPAFFAARLHTGFLREHAAELQPAPAEPDMTAAVLSAAALTDPALRRMAFETPEPYASIGQWRN
jgi:propionyl-CoA carboxylase alpha chain/3-methylcrotonyl-CoA carboxylase alpha subunit/acetyl-CoA/propionyl-CoA carboxylase biotin carboxyl carrier protein